MGAKAEAETAPAARIARTFMVEFNLDAEDSKLREHGKSFVTSFNPVVCVCVFNISNVHADQTPI